VGGPARILEWRRFRRPRTQALLGLSNVNIGGITLTTTAGALSASATTGSAYANFYSYSTEQLSASSLLQLPSLGSCVVTESPWEPPIGSPSGLKQLDAGPQIVVTGPGASLVLPRSASAGGYIDPSGSASGILPAGGGTLARISHR
jgi:hypothetical protein